MTCEELTGRKEEVVITTKGGGRDDQGNKLSFCFVLAFYHVRPLPYYSVIYASAEIFQCPECLSFFYQLRHFYMVHMLSVRILQADT